MQFQELNSDTRILIIRINHTNAGFFAYLSFVLNQILYCEEHNLLPVVYFGPWSVNGPNAYHDLERGDNMWDYYFHPVAGYTYSDIQLLIADPKHLITEKNLVHLHDDVLSYLHAGNPDSIYNYPYGYYADLEENLDNWYTRQRQKAQKLIEKYIEVRKELVAEVETFINQNFKGHQVLGVHIRGTDKERESKRIERIIPPQEYFSHIDAFISQFPDSKIFLATDQVQYVEQMQRKYPGRVLTQSTILSDSKVNSFQKADGNNYQKGKEVLFDCLILSRCHQLLKCTSAVSEYAHYFNADLTSLDLNELYGSSNTYQKIRSLLLVEPYIFIRDLAQIVRGSEKNKLTLFRHALIGYPLFRRLLDPLEASQFSGSLFWAPFFFLKKYAGLVLNKESIPFQRVKQLTSHGLKRKGAGYYLFSNAKGKKYLEIRADGNPQATFFTQFLTVLQQLHFAEANHLTPVVNLDHIYSYYYDANYGTNVWENYFEPIKAIASTELDKIDSQTITLIRPEEQLTFFPGEANLDFQNKKWWHNRQRAHGARLTADYILLRPEILEVIDDIYKTHWQGHTVLGIDLNRPEKHGPIEKGHMQFGRNVQPEEFFPFIDKFLSLNPGGKLFITTDQNQFMTTLIKQYGDQVIHTKNIGSGTETSALNSSGKGYNQGIDALINVLLLSKSDFLIKGCSNAGEVATYFNPKVPVIDLFYPQDIDDFEYFFSKPEPPFT